MAVAEKTFDFDIQPSTLNVPGPLLPGMETRVTFQICNTSYRPLRGEVLLAALEGPPNPEGVPIPPEAWEAWLALVEAPEYDYAPQSMRSYTVRVLVPGGVMPGTYAFILKLVDMNDPDRVCISTLPVSFTVGVQPYNPRAFQIGLIVLLALILAGVSAAIYFIPPGSALAAKLTAPTAAKVGEPAEYIIELENTRKDAWIENVVVEYRYPPEKHPDGASNEFFHNIQGAWAVIREPAEPLAPRCGSKDQLLRCTLGDFAPGQKVKLSVYVLPGPLQPAQPPADDQSEKSAAATATARAGRITRLDHRSRFSLLWKEDGKQRPAKFLDPGSQKETDISAQDLPPVSVRAIPAVDVAAVGLPVKIWLIGWNNSEEKNIELTFTLPHGMRYHFLDARSGFLDPRNACKQDAGNYFIIHCAAAASEARTPAQFEIQAVPLQTAPLYALKVESAAGQPVTRKTGLPAASSQLAFNGQGEWAQLGYASMPATFTAALWVNPRSLSDGQALIGAHHLSKDAQGQALVRSNILVGYYNGAISVNIMGDNHVLDLVKTAEPFHLAIVVDSQNKNKLPVVRAYMNGVQQNWKTTPKSCGVKECQFSVKINEAKIGGRTAGNEVDFNWVIGQDWDPYRADITTSDFFHGAVSDVRLWGSALTEAEVREELYLPPRLLPGCQGAQEDNCDSRNLLGWWPLARTGGAGVAQPAGCVLPKQGRAEPQEIDGQPELDACLLADLGPHKYHGARSGGAWESATIQYGNALALDGKSALHQGQVVLSDLKKAESTNPIPVTMSAWVSVDSLTYRKQVVLADVFRAGMDQNSLAGAGLVLDSDGRMVAFYNLAAENLTGASVKDEKPISVGRWTHYALVFFYDPTSGKPAQFDDLPYVLLFRDGERVKGVLSDENYLRKLAGEQPKPGFSLGGFGSPESAFRGRLDEVRVWGRALLPEDKKDYISPEIDLWRRQPGIAFDEYVYWSFDDNLELGTAAPCPTGSACSHTQNGYRLLIEGQSWAPSDLKIGYAVVSSE